MTEQPRVGILTTFYEMDSSYSLCSVVESQLIMLLKHGYKPVLFVHDNFKDSDRIPPEVEVRKVVPRFLLIDYTNCQAPAPDLEDQAKKVYDTLREHAKDIDVFIEHDLIFQGWFLPYCMGIHRFANESNIKWFHWVHSVPRPAPMDCKYPHTLRFKLPSNSKLVYLNNVHVIRAAEAYGLYPKDVRVVYNAMDPRLFWRPHDLVSQLIDRYDLLGADIIQTYPVSTPRMVDGKGIHALIEIFAHLKGLGKKVRLIICNGHANDKREKQLIAETYAFAAQKGLHAGELIFTSIESQPTYELGVPREVVSDLFRLSNLFIFPTQSENCSLILLEAMLSGNLLVLNENVPSLREFGKENAIYFKFGSIDESITYNNRSQYMLDIARIIISEMSTNRAGKSAVMARQQYNLDAIFKKQIEPLLYEDYGHKVHV